MNSPWRPPLPGCSLLCLLMSSGCVPARVDAPQPPVDAGVATAAPTPAPRTRLECGPTEMSCCGACISKSEGHCPENIQCRTPEAAPTQ